MKHSREILLSCFYLILWCHIYVFPQPIGIIVRVFANSPGDRSLIPGRVIPKIQKMVLDHSLLNTRHYKVWIKSKSSNQEKEVAPSPTPHCCSYWERNLRIALDYRRPTYLYIHIYIYIYIIVIIMSRMDFPDPLSPSVSIVHCSRQVFKATSCIGTELLF